MKCMIVLGMHSSTTSLIAKSLHRAGVLMWLRNTDNHYEDLDIVGLNSWLLKQAGGDWKNPPAVKAMEEIAQCVDISEYVQAREKRAQKKNCIWGFKDPRTVLTWPVWRRHLDMKSVHTLFVDRDTHETAKSCARRKKGEADWLELVRDYKSRMTEIKKELET